jgi:hypothetical protein
MVAAPEFGKRSTFRPSPSGLDLLRGRQFRRTAHALSALLRPAAALAPAQPKISDDPKPIPEDARRSSDETKGETLADIAHSYNVSPATISRL